MKMAKQKWNPVAKNLHKFHKPKRIEDKRYKKQIKRMEKEIREVRAKRIKEHQLVTTPGQRVRTTTQARK